MNPRRLLLRRMGYVRDQEGIMNRYLREKEHWESHLMHTREFILGAFEKASIRSVAVLGSGWLLDVPLEELRSRFDTIFLVDVRHPPQIRKKTSSMKNVHLLEEDLSGGALEQVWKETRRKENRRKENRRKEYHRKETGRKETGLVSELTEQIHLTPPLKGIAPDAWVSVNLLNQLDIILCDYLETHRRFRKGSQDPLRKRLQEFHLEWISDRPGCLVTDIREVSVTKEGRETIRTLLHTPLPGGIREDQWNWDFDTGGTYRDGVRTRMEVAAVEWS